jgi:hypothetical protein
VSASPASKSATGPVERNRTRKLGMRQSAPRVSNAEVVRGMTGRRTDIANRTPGARRSLTPCDVIGRDSIHNEPRPLRDLPRSESPAGRGSCVPRYASRQSPPQRVLNRVGMTGNVHTPLYSSGRAADGQLQESTRPRRCLQRACLSQSQSTRCQEARKP